MKNFVSAGLRVHGGILEILDQRLLPGEERWVESRTPEDMIGFIRTLAVRGAPLIGVAAALALARYLENESVSEREFRAAVLALREARPTAVNLMAAVDRMLALPFDRASLIAEAEKICDEDVALCAAMAERGAALINDGDGVLTHCNAGGLATAGLGTAVGVILRAHQLGKKFHVFVDETRPLLQGARLTAWELKRAGVPHTLICDNMAGALMAKGKVQKIFVGADRIAANGDVANKIGTYSVAVLAKHHGIPLYVVAPRTTFDPSCPTGREIPVEERSHEEVSRGAATESVWNPAFDVTPRALIAGIIADDGMK